MGEPTTHPLRMAPFSGAVLAGGASRRMGRDKALMVVDGTALVRRVADALRDAGAAEILVVGGGPAAASTASATAVADRWPGEGPLGGVVTALEAAAHDPVVVLGCDLPFASALVVADLLAALDAEVDVDVAVAVDASGQDQWMYAAWRRRTVAALAGAFTRGLRAPREAARERRVARVEAPSRALVDVDTPAALAGLDVAGRDRT